MKLLKELVMKLRGQASTQQLIKKDLPLGLNFQEEMMYILTAVMLI